MIFSIPKIARGGLFNDSIIDKPNYHLKKGSLRKHLNATGVILNSILNTMNENSFSPEI